MAFLQAMNGLACRLVMAVREYLKEDDATQADCGDHWQRSAPPSHTMANGAIVRALNT